MNKIVLFLFSILFSYTSVGSNKLTQNLKKPLRYEVGLVKLMNPITLYSSSFETGEVSSCSSIRLMKETTHIKFLKGRAFGVIINNLKHNTRVRAVWRYPTILNTKSNHKNSVYASPEVFIKNKKYGIYWELDNVEKAGIYRLDIYINSTLKKTVRFNLFH